jgi:hypothetical protein
MRETQQGFEKAPLQMACSATPWCPRTWDKQQRLPPSPSRTGNKLVIGFDLMEPHHFDAKEGDSIRAASGYLWTSRIAEQFMASCLQLERPLT